MAQGLERETKGQSRGKDAEEKLSKFVRCGQGRVMGSRRIFPPQFKLQVLDSYRKDEDCKGNQRATARKYGIHRRQIQKWLQVEDSLRTSVEVGNEQPLQQAATPTALNLTSASDAARQRDDRSGGGGGESLLVAVPTYRQRCGEPEVSSEERTPAQVKLEESEEQERFINLFKEEDDEEEEEEEEGETSEDNMDSVTFQHNPDEALDFTCAALGKRRSFSLSFKLKVLNAFHVDGMCHGNQRATARKFGINRRQVQKWLGQEVELRGEAALRGGLYRQRLGRWPEMDDGMKLEDTVHTPMSTPIFDPYNQNEQCWDLSSKKRKHGVEHNDTVYKKWVTEQADLNDQINETLDVSSTSGRDPGCSSYGQEQETALCLVKVKGEPEVTSSVDTNGFHQERFLTTAPSPFHIGPLVLPPNYDFYAFHCRHPSLQHLHSPKWFHSRAAAVPGYY